MAQRHPQSTYCLTASPTGGISHAAADAPRDAAVFQTDGSGDRHPALEVNVAKKLLRVRKKFLNRLFRFTVAKYIQNRCIRLSSFRHHEIPITPPKLSQYCLALSALCYDPRQFHGHDLIGTLQHHEVVHDLEFAYATLAACSARAHVRKKQIRRLLDIANTAKDHNIGKGLSSDLFGRELLTIGHIL